MTPRTSTSPRPTRQQDRSDLRSREQPDDFLGEPAKSCPRYDGRRYQWCMIWCMKRTNIYLAEGQAAALDRAAQAAGVSRAELIRELIDRAIGGHPGADLLADLAAIDGSFGILTGEDAFTRGRDERMDYLDRLAGA
jgi:hypothetical protein